MKTHSECFVIVKSILHFGTMFCRINARFFNSNMKVVTIAAVLSGMRNTVK